MYCCFKKHFVVLVIFLFSSYYCYPQDTGSENILSTLRVEHPRLFISKGDEARILALKNSDNYFGQLVKLVMMEADRSLTAPVIQYKKEGKRLLGQTRAALSRIAHLAMAFQLTQEQKYLKRAEKEMLAAAALKDWNPSHFLDAAEMAAGMAIGYDWLYNELLEDSKKTIRTALIEKAFEPAFEEPEPWWVTATHNWNQVCHGGLVLAGLAIAEDEPQWARKIVTRALKHAPDAMRESYEPYGVYTEGPGYWNYGTSYNVLLIGGLESALGSDFGLSGMPGFKESAIYRLVVVGPDGNFFSYSDCGRHGGITPSLYWFAKQFNQPEITWFTCTHEQKTVSYCIKSGKNGGYLLPLGLLWYRPAVKAQRKLPLEYFGNGPNPIALFRTSWEDEQSLWLATKGGNNENNHNHMDAGTFVIYAGGVRWSNDLGSDNYYALEQLAPDLWGDGRYDFFRLGVQGHSTLWLNGAQMEIHESASPIIKFFSSPQRSHAVIDMSKPWRKQSDKVMRGTAILKKRSFLIQDEITGAKGEILWQMITVDSIELNQSSAVMSKNGQRFHARILTPKNAVFETRSVQPVYKEENQNEGYGKLVIRIQAENKSIPVILAVHMWLEDKDTVQTPDIIPLAEWRKTN